MSHKLPDGWREVRIKDFCTVKRGASPRPINDPKWFGGDIGWVRISDVTASNKYLYATKDYLSNEGVRKSVLIYDGDLIVSICATIGRPIIVRMKACIHDGFVWFDGFQLSVDTHFFYYFFLLNENKLASSRQHGTQGNLNTSIIGNTYILLPPLEEQRKIADILGTVDDKLASIDQQITATETLKKGLMQQLFTKGIGHTEFKQTEIGTIPKAWEKKQVKQFSEVVRGASPRPKGDPRYYGGDVPRLMGEDVTRDYKYVYPSVDFLTKEGAIKSRLMPKGTLTIVCSGNVGVPSFLVVDACIHDGFLGFKKINESVCVEYLFYFFLFSISYANSKATHGGVFTNLTTSILKEWVVPLPPLDEQEKIASILTEVDNKIDSLKKRKSAYTTLKTGLMQQLLTGQKRVKVCP